MSISTLGGFAAAQIRSHDAMPSIFGIRTSISTTSGRARLDEVDRLLAVGGLADDREVGLGLQDHPQPLADHRLVVDQRDANHHETTNSRTGGVSWRTGDASSGNVALTSQPPVAPGTGGERATERGDAFAHPDQAVAAGGLAAAGSMPRGRCR